MFVKSTNVCSGLKNKDVVSAHLNIGDADLTQNPSVALQVAGQRYSAQLDKHLRTSLSTNKWAVKTRLRNQAFGTVDIKATLRASGLFAAFQQLGADDETTLEVPLHIEIGGKSFDIPVSTDFQITGQRGRADGSL